MRFYEDYLLEGQPMLIPDADVTITGTDLDASDAGRDESGVMHRIRVRKRVKTWGFQYFALTKEEYQYLQELLSRNAVFDFTHTLPDGTRETCRAYCSNDSISYQNARLGLYRNFRFNIIAC